VTLQEFQRGLKTIGFVAGKKRNDELFQTIDKDSSGTMLVAEILPRRLKAFQQAARRRCAQATNGRARCMRLLTKLVEFEHDGADRRAAGEPSHEPHSSMRSFGFSPNNPHQ
jgi:hypothetical protein